MAYIRFKPDCVKWILEGSKKTTFRFRRYDGVYELAGGSLFNPKPLGVFFILKPIKRIPAYEVIEEHYSTEGPFSSREEFVDWLRRSRLLKRFQTDKLGWLHSVKAL